MSFADTVDDDEIDAAELGDSFISQRIRIFLKTFWLDLACLFEAARLAYEADQRGAQELNESFHFAVMNQVKYRVLCFRICHSSSCDCTAPTHVTE